MAGSESLWIGFCRILGGKGGSAFMSGAACSLPTSPSTPLNCQHALRSWSSPKLGSSAAGCPHPRLHFKDKKWMPKERSPQVDLLRPWYKCYHVNRSCLVRSILLLDIPDTNVPCFLVRPSWQTLLVICWKSLVWREIKSSALGFGPCHLSLKHLYLQAL